MRLHGLVVILLALYLQLIVGNTTAEIEGSVSGDEDQRYFAVDSDFLFLSINKSSLPFERVGLGVFSKVPIYNREIICEYRGVVVPAHVPFQSDYM